MENRIKASFDLGPKAGQVEDLPANIERMELLGPQLAGSHERTVVGYYMRHPSETLFRWTQVQSPTR